MSLVIHPAITTHYRMDEAPFRAAGINEGTVRMSVGRLTVVEIKGSPV